VLGESTSKQELLQRRLAERTKAEAEHSRTKRRVEEVEGRAAQAMAAVLEAGLDLAKALKAVTRPLRKLETARCSAEPVFRRLDSTWQAARQLREPWRRALALQRKSAQEASSSSATSAEAAQCVSAMDRELKAAEVDERSRRLKRETCEVEVEATRAMRDAAEADQAKWKRRRDELRGSLGSTFLDVLRSRAAMAEAASEQEALKSWCSRAENVQVNMESAISSAVKVLRGEQYNAKQVEEAYEARRKQRTAAQKAGLRPVP